MAIAASYMFRCPPVPAGSVGIGKMNVTDVLDTDSSEHFVGFACRTVHQIEMTGIVDGLERRVIGYLQDLLEMRFGIKDEHGLDLEGR